MIEAPARLSTLLKLLRANGVKSYRNGDVALELADGVAKAKPAKAPRPSVDAIDLALDSPEYDPDKVDA